MPKRGRSKDANPLSSARKDVGSKSSSNSAINKADQNALSLWHRKSGAGYHLFISYYGSQPMGVVADDTTNDASYDVSCGASASDGNNSSVTTNGSSRGMSRAAKRRRQKKKSSRIDSVSNEQISNTSINSCSGSRTSNIDTSNPLIEAFTSTNKKYPHLTRLIHALSRPLPLTLRFREHEQSTSELKQTLSKDYSQLIGPVLYDPLNNIYQSTPNSSLCKANLSKISPKLKELIVDASMDGTLARQELGSMLPVLCLRAVGAVKGGAKLLDLCASPGSKTLQALEIVSDKSNNDKRGRVIANDVHPGRLDSLREAVLRSGLPDSLTSRVTYTNYDASIFPAPKSGKLFDAIICDVPCGGDGTIRKDKHILPMWSPNISNNIHSLQLKILLRALELVKVGGAVCYSTCSLNPIEDEAVVSAALLKGDNNEKFEVLEWPTKTMLPGFIGRPGVVDWKVAFYDQNTIEKDDEDFDKDFGSLSFFDSYESAVSAGIDDARPTFWPKMTKNKHLQLDRCIRLLPQDQDTGGFFISLIKRVH